MQGRNHFIVGIATVLLAEKAVAFIKPHSLGEITLGKGLMLGLATAAAAIGAFAPDVDSKSSSAAHYSGTGHGSGCLTRLVFYPIRRLLGGHRALTHSLWAILAVAAVCGFWCWPGIMGNWNDLGTAFSLGYISHIAADMLTRDGVRFFYPVWRAEIGLGPRRLRFRTGSWIEYVVVVAAIAATLWILFF